MSTAYSSAKQQYIGNGATTEWGFDFPIQKHSELKVYLKRSGQAQVLLTEGVDYSFVTENTIAFPIKTGEAKLQAADVLALQRESVFESEYNFSNQQRLEPEEVMNADDNLERQIQELKRDSEAAIKVLPTSNVDPNTFFEHVERVYGSVDNIDIVADDKANLDTVAGNIADVNTVADDIESVKTVANNIESVVIDATNIANVNTVAGSIGNVNTVSGSIGNVNVVAPSIDSVNAVAPKVAEVSTVSANIADVNTVAESITNVNRVGQSIANVNTVAGVSDEVDQVAMIADQTKKVGDNISDVMTVASVSEQVKTVAANATAVKDIGDNIDTVLQAPEDARKASVWAEGNDSQVESLGGTHSAKVWASIAASIAQIDSASETKQGIARIATADEAVAGTNDLTIITPLKAKYIADEYTGKVVQLGFNGVLENNVLTFTPDQDPYEIKTGYEYEVDLLFPAAGVLPDNTPMVIQNGTDTIVIVNVKDADASSAMTYGNMKQMCRYDAEVGWRWIFNARYAVTDTGVKVLVMPSAVIDDSRYVTTDTAQNITAGKNFINNATSTTTDAHTGMSICLKNSESDITANTQNADGSVDFKYQGIRFVDKNNEETGFIYNAPDGVGGSFTRVGTSAKVDGQYVDSFIEMEVDANGKGHVYLPSVDEDATVSGNQAATVDYVKNNYVGLTGNQTISGLKTFTQQRAIDIEQNTNQQEVPSSGKAGQIGLYKNKTYTKGDGYSSWVQGYRGNNGYTVSGLYACRFLETDEEEIKAVVGSAISPDGVPYAYCTQTPTTNTPSNAIATANYVNAASRGYLVESYRNGTEWYRVYSDGWIEQGGRASVGIDGAITVTFLRPFSDTNYYANWISCSGASLSGAGTRAMDTLTTTTARIFNGLDITMIANWMACGY